MPSYLPDLVHLYLASLIAPVHSILCEPTNILSLRGDFIQRSAMVLLKICDRASFNCSGSERVVSYLGICLTIIYVQGIHSRLLADCFLVKIIEMLCWIIHSI